MISRWKSHLDDFERGPGDESVTRPRHADCSRSTELLVVARTPVHALSPNFQVEFKNHSLLLTSLEANGTPPNSVWYTLQEALVGKNREEVVLLNAAWLLVGPLTALKGMVLTGVLFATSVSRMQALVTGFLLGSAVAFPIPGLERHSRLADARSTISEPCHQRVHVSNSAPGQCGRRDCCGHAHTVVPETNNRSATLTHREWLVPAWSVAAIGTPMFALLAETGADGKVVYPGNFAWGAIPANSGLHVVSASEVRSTPWKLR